MQRTVLGLPMLSRQGISESIPRKAPARIAGMFDAIAPRYDLLNHVLSAGMDRGWRNRAVDALALPDHARVLDLCTGTGDLALAAVARARGASVIGVDFAAEMLRLGLTKVRAASLESRIRLVRGDAARIPVGDATCDAATIGLLAFRTVGRSRPVRWPRSARGETRRPPGDPRVRTAPNTPASHAVSWYFRYCCRSRPAISSTRVRISYLPASVVPFPRRLSSRRSSLPRFFTRPGRPSHLRIVYLLLPGAESVLGRA